MLVSSVFFFVIIGPHRHKSNVLPGGGGGGSEPFAHKFLQVAQIFMKRSKRNEDHMSS